jgi:hypothetical protein
MPAKVSTVLRAVALTVRQGQTPSAESIEFLDQVGFIAEPWLLAQQRWRCTHCEHPAVRFQHTMGLVHIEPGSIPVASNGVPCLPSCIADHCQDRVYADHQEMLRAVRDQPPTAARQPPASAQCGEEFTFRNDTCGGSEVMKCGSCDKTAFRNTQKSFKRCSRCGRTRYWYARPSLLRGTG